MKNNINMIWAYVMLHSGMACIAIHMLSVLKSKQTWARARAGIMREFNPRRFRLY